MIASKVAPNAPTAPASLGVAHPNKIDPLIRAINITGGKKAFNIIIGSSPPFTSNASSGNGGATFLSTVAHT